MNYICHLSLVSSGMLSAFVLVIVSCCEHKLNDILSKNTLYVVIGVCGA